MRALLSSLLTKAKEHRITLFLTALLAVVSFIYSTHLSLELVPKGYDLLFHLGNVFALQIKFAFEHNTLAWFGISPLIFHDYGYGTHLFYPPLAHLIPAFISYVMSLVGINSTLVAVRIFSFLTIFFSGATMYFAAKKISNHTVFATFASFLYLSAPYMQMDYYWRGGMSSSLCFVFLPILLLSIYYFTKEKYAPFFFAFVVSMMLIVWTHLITAFYSFILFMLAIGVNFFFVKNKKMAFLSTLVAGILVGLMTSPFWSLLVQQQMVHTHFIYSPDYPFSIESVGFNTIKLAPMFDIQFKVWEFKIRSLNALFTVANLIFVGLTLVLFPRIHKTFKNRKFLYTLLGLLALLFFMAMNRQIWQYLPKMFVYIQFPHRLFLLVTPILSLLIAMPFLLLRKVNAKVVAGLGAVATFVLVYTFIFNNYELYDIATIDYTTHSIIQAMGVEQEYLPVQSRKEMEPLETRGYGILPLTNNETATPSATIVENETPYMLAKIENNQGKETVFELPRLFYAGYELKWQADGESTRTTLPYEQSEDGLITVLVPGNGTLQVNYTGGKWYSFLWLGAVTAAAYLGWLAYQYFYTKKRVWLGK